MEDLALFIIYYLFAGLGILGSSHVLITILSSFQTIQTCSTLLVLFLHFSLLSEEIAALPFLFTYDDTMCSINESFFEYFSLMNIVVIGFIVYAHRLSILDPSIRLPKPVVKGLFAFAVIFPMITFLPFAHDDVYRKLDKGSPWCSVPYSTGWQWVLGVYLVWVWFILTLSIISSIDLAVRLSNTYQGLLKSYLSTIGLYCIISLACWIPRSMARFLGDDTNITRFIAYIPIYISGMLYSLIFRKSKETMEAYETARLVSYEVQGDDLINLFNENDLVQRYDSIASSDKSQTEGEGSQLTDDLIYFKQKFGNTPPVPF
jgi:hypothetical protein